MDCCEEQWTGGKASNLAKILAYSNLNKEKMLNFLIPKGFVITVFAYEEFLNQNLDLKNLLNILNDDTKL